ncbi:MAG: endonuclease [Candidatus Cloacimonadaceae bacterium]
MMLNRIVLFLGLMLFSVSALTATTVFSDDFSDSQSANWTTSGQLGSSSFYLNRSGDDWGGRRNTNGILELTNDASATANAAGWVFANTSTAGFTSPYNATLSSNSGLVTWSFNLRQIRTDPAGFGSGNYGVALILATTNQTANNNGTGYAVVLGQSGSTDPIRLARFSGGLSTGLTDIITSNSIGLADFGAEYLSIMVTYDPTTNTWELFLRNDGITEFTNPLNGVLVSQGTAVDNTYTNAVLNYMGGYWQGSTSANQTAFFDNITVQVEQAVTAFLEVTPNSLTGFSYILNNGPSNEQSFIVSGSELTANIIITPPADYQISTGTGGSFNPTNQITLTQSGGVVEPTTIYVRLKAALTAGDYNIENISISTAGATTQYVSCSGTVLAPLITLSASTLSGFNYMVTLGPSQPKTFTVYGSNLYADLYLNAPVDYEFSTLAGSNYSAQIILSPIDNTVNTTTIYVRLKAGLPIGNYNNEVITVSSSGAVNQTVTCSGSVTAGLAPEAPLALSATSIMPNSFTANWNAATNATGYRLDVLTGSANIASDLLISEYVEGSSYNKYIEIYNGTDTDVDLSDYRLQLYSNGASTPTQNIQLTGTLDNGACIVYKNSGAVLTLPDGVTATDNSAVNFNGNDAVALYKISTGSFVDIFGRIGENPGDQWGTSPLWTINTTLVRKSSVTSGVTTNPSSGFPTLATEWDYYIQDTASYLGSHSISNTLAYVPGYENLDVGNVTSYPVTGLDELTEYHYVVRAVNSFGTSDDSNEISLITPLGTAPLIIVTGTLNTFSTSLGTPSAVQNYSLAAANLTADIILSIPDGFELSTNGGSVYHTVSTSVPSTFNGTVLIRLTGSVSGTYSGNIVHSSSGASNVNLYVYGTVTGGAIVAPTVQASGIVPYPSTTSMTLEWTPGNGSYRVVKINTINSFTVPGDGTSPAVSSGYSGSGEQVIYNGATEFIEGLPFNGCTVTNLIPNTIYWFRIYEYNGTGVETKYLSTTATNNPLSATTLQTSGTEYYDSIYGYSTTLKGLLHSLIKDTHSTQFSYTATTDQLRYTDEDPSNLDNVIEIYTGWSLDKNSYGIETADWNKEHTWSKSHGDFGDNAPAGTDIHNLRPCDATINSAKSNKDFDNGGTAVTDSSPPTGYSGVTGCYQTYNTWEPRPEDKGDVARMIMYMAVRYEGTDTSYDLELVDYVYSDAGTNQPYYGKLATLLQWHVQDPPDAWELRRNNRIAERQGNRNPFIDRPGYAARIWTPCPLYNSEISTTGFTGHWSTPLSATDYFLQVATDSLFTSLVSGYENLDVNLVTSKVITGLQPGRTYYYRLRSYFLTDYSMYSPYLSVTLNLPAVVATSATGITTSGFTANWQAVSGITEYQFDLSTSSSFDSFVTGYNALSVTGTSLNVTGLDYNTTYYYRLRAVYEAVAGPNSNTVTATTQNIAAPPAPTNVMISVSGNDIVITWDADAAATSWKVYSSDDPYTGFAEPLTVYTNSITLTGQAFTYGKRFYYVTADN